ERKGKHCQQFPHFPSLNIHGLADPLTPLLRKSSKRVPAFWESFCSGQLRDEHARPHEDGIAAVAACRRATAAVAGAVRTGVLDLEVSDLPDRPLAVQDAAGVERVDRRRDGA